MHETARRLERHLQDRAVHFGFRSAMADQPVARDCATRRDAIMALLRWLQAESAFRAEDRLEVMLAITGGLAAALHADHARGRLPASLVRRIVAEMDPVGTVEIKVFCFPWRDRRILPAEVMAALIRPLPDEYAAKRRLPFSFVHHPGQVDVLWNQPVTMGEFSYAPLVARISVVTQGWPLLSHVSGLPVLSLPDLVREYFTRASEGVDNLAARRLRDSAGLLPLMLTYFEANDAIDPDGPRPAPAIGIDIEAVIAQIEASASAATSALRAEALRQIAPRGPIEARVLAALIAACTTLRTPAHRAGVLKALLDHDDLVLSAYLLLLPAVAAVGESGELAQLLLSAAGSAPLAGGGLDALLRATEGIERPAPLAAVLMRLARRDLAAADRDRIAAIARARIGNRKTLQEVLAALAP